MFLEKILQELIRKSDEEKICEALHIPLYYRGCIYSRFTLETNKRLVRAGLIGHYKITENQKVEFCCHENSYCIRIICRAIHRGENGEAEEVNAELRVPFLEFEQAIDIDARMEENIRSVIGACDRVVHERIIQSYLTGRMCVTGAGVFQFPHGGFQLPMEEHEGCFYDSPDCTRFLEIIKNKEEEKQ